MKSKQNLLVATATLLTILLMPVKAHAALQANGSGASTKTIDQWMSEVRAMEALGGTLGLTGSSSLNQQPEENGKVANSNNLDIHMQKNTEYGAMAILSASSYGKSTPVHVTNNGTLSTTTGNKSGVYMNINTEWVSTRHTGSNSENLKYMNIYTTNGKERRAGDALFECSGWHNTGVNVDQTWLSYNGCMIRANTGSIFSFYYGLKGSANELTQPSRKWASRAVVVIGERNIIIDIVF